ncbi:MAG: SpaA isopeptide-forming pilin-related protein [Eubacteriales bacterium]|nr:SpaA isopeptide-forming pilin-related protein [Eubacteriales bacterium]
MKKVKKLFAAFLTLCMVLGLGGMSVLAASATDKATVKVTGFGTKTPKVKIYQIWKANYSGTSFVDWNKVAGTENLYDENHPTEADINTIAQKLQANPATITPHDLGAGVVVEKDVAGGEVGFEVPAGVYIAVITPEAGNTATYNPVLLAASYNENGLQAGSVDVTSKYLHPENAVAKSSEPSVKKEASATKDDSVTPAVQTGGVGQDVTYTVTPTLPQYPANAINKTFYFSDTMSNGLTFKFDSLKIQLKGVAEPVAHQNGTFTHNGKTIATAKQVGNGFNLSFVYDEVKTLEPKLEYKATINADAIVGKPGNPNHVEMFYTNNPNQGDTYEDTNEKPDEGNGIVKKEDEEEVYTYQITFKKVNEDGTQPLAGAVFGIYNNAECKPEHLVDTVTTNAQGWASSSQVGKGDYWIKEIKAPAGYSLLTDVKKVTANWTSVTKKKSSTEEIIRYTTESTKAIQPPVAKGWLKDGVHYDVDPGEGGKVAYILEKTTKSSSSEATITNNNAAPENGGEGDGVVQFDDIKNTKIPQLPSTGGMGTYLFTIVGVAIIAIATGLFFVKRRSRA